VVLNDANDVAVLVAVLNAARASPDLDLGPDLEEREKNKQTPNIQKTQKTPN